jgi:hypothetical protein
MADVEMSESSKPRSSESAFLESVVGGRTEGRIFVPVCVLAQLDRGAGCE